MSRGLRLGWETLGHFPNLELEEISPIAATHVAPPMTDNGAPEESNGGFFVSYLTLFLSKPELAQTPSKPERDREERRRTGEGIQF